MTVDENRLKAAVTRLDNVVRVRGAVGEGNGVAVAAAAVLVLDAQMTRFLDIVERIVQLLEQEGHE